MRKRKILFVTEAHFHPTGYSVYTKEVLKRLHENPNFEVAELACFVGPEAEELKSSPWKIYPNMPASDNAEAMNAYNSSVSNKFGEFSLNSVLLDFQPDFVMDIRDFWMCLRRGSKIVSKNGVVEVQNIKKGDAVLTHTGSYKKVVDTFEREYSGDIYNIKTKYDLYPVWLTENHPILIAKHRPGKDLANKIVEWVNSQDVKVGDFACFPIKKFGELQEDPNLTLLRGYYTALSKKDKKTALIFKIPLDKPFLVDTIKDLYFKCYSNKKSFIVKKSLKHISLSLKACPSFLKDIQDKSKPLELNEESSLRFLSAVMNSKAQLSADGKRVVLKKLPDESKRNVFMMSLRYGILFKSSAYSLCASDSYSYKNVRYVMGDESVTHQVQHPKITRKYAFFRVNSKSSQSTSENVYNFEVEEDNSYVSSFAIHNCEHIDRSPFRDLFNFALMPTVDAEPQNPQWMNVFSRADAIFAYSEFGRDVMLKQNKDINFIDVASPCASETFVPMDKAKIRKEFNLDENAIIFGTVMRNQRRKLFPSLFKAFRKFLDDNPQYDNVYLYCHTGYPDVGWDIPALIVENGLSSRVLLTYKCRHCGKVTASFFHDAVKVCKSCNNLSNQIVGIGNKMGEEDLAKIYNLFDVYVQWANSEGYGMSQPEAARCKLPVVSVKYSAMESFVENVGGVGVEPLSLYKELETGCDRAVPDEDSLAHVMYRMVAFPDYRKQVAEDCYNNYMKIYSWDKTAQKWADYFMSQPLKDPKLTWASPPRIFNPAQTIPPDLEKAPISDQVNWLFVNVLGRPDWINNSTWQKMVKDLTYKLAISHDIPGYYLNDFSHPDVEKKYDLFDLGKAYQLCINLRNYINQWEQIRYEKNKIYR